ncbi:MAG: hypothetical protein ACOCWU_06655 [Spirochaetota bacterium]
MCLSDAAAATWPEPVARFLREVEWVFAKTYADTWPHEYIVRDRVDRELFLEMVRHIRENGYLGSFYHRQITYFRDGNLVYWTMVPPVDDSGWYPPQEETIVNRCPVESTYEYRLEHGTLP